MCIIKALLDWASFLLAVAAAVLWLYSARVKTPDTFTITVSAAGMGPPLGGDPVGGAFVGVGHSPELVTLANALRWQSSLSAWAARCAGISALCQGFALIAARCIAP